MRIKALQVVNIPFVLPYYFGDQIKFLKDIGINITIACSPGTELTKFCSKYGVNEVPVHILRKIDFTTDLKSLIQLYRVIKKEKFDYVIGHTPKGALLSMIAAKLAGVKNRVYFRHGIVFETSEGVKRKLMLFLENLTTRLATQVISVSPSVLKLSKENSPKNSSKDMLLNKGTCNGIDLNRFISYKSNEDRAEFGISIEDRVIGFVGRLVNDKGINELIDAWKIIISENHNVKLLLVGPFEDRDTLSTEIKEYIQNEPSIIYTGHVDNTLPYYNVMDIFILPSYREGFPTVVLEASAMSLPIITTKSTGCIDSIVENETGVFSKLNGVALADKIQFYLINERLRKQHGQNGRAWVEENFDQHVVWNCIKEAVFKI